MLAFAAWFSIALHGAIVAVADEQPEAAAPSFHNAVAPILAKYCVGCHNADDAEGKLVLDGYDKLLAGGEHGAVLVAGQPERSRLILVLTGKAEPAMPPEGSESPTADEVATLERWIAAGAPGPDGAAPDPTKLVIPHIEPRVTPRHPIHAVAYSPDGKLLAVAGFREIRLYSPENRALVRRLEGHAGNVMSVSFSPDGSKLISAAGEPGLFGEARLWNVADGSLLREVRGHKDSLYSAVLTPDGALLATAGYDQAIILWEANTGAEVRTITGHNGAVYDLAFSADGKFLASASADRTVKLWEVATGARLDTFGQPLEDQYTVAFSPDGQRLVGAGRDNRIRVWELSESRAEGTNKLLYARFAHEGAIGKLAFSRDGKLLASTAEDRTVKIWDAESVVERLLLEPQSDWSAALGFSPDGKTLAVGRLDGELVYYDVPSGKHAPPAAPELAQLEPRGLQRGVATRVRLVGKNLLGLEKLDFGKHAFEVKLLASENSSPDEVIVEIAPSAELSRGTYDVRAITAGGQSKSLRLEVDDLAQQVESEPNSELAQATEVALPITLWGKLGSQGDVDHFSFAAEPGKTVVLAVDARALKTKANIVLTLFDAAGRVVASNNDFDGESDPLVAFDPPVAGRYTVRISDLLQSGSEEHVYRLSVGAFPYVTGVFPLSVAANQESSAQLAGYNLPAEARVTLPAQADGEISVPLDPQQYRARRGLKVLVGMLPESVESEPNDEPDTATIVNVPCTVGGRIWSDTPTSDADLFRFESRAGQTWIVETDGDGRGSPIDTAIEVLDAVGQPLPRLLLQATRDSYIDFRSIDSKIADVRVHNWEEMELNELMYLDGEVCKIFRLPQGPDSGFNFYTSRGQRIAYFDTSSTAHAVHEACYIVSPHAPGTALVPNGLPVFTLHYSNDDDGLRKLGRDSRLTFTAPADGQYLVRVRDVRGGNGDRFAYRLTIREPRPDFSVAVSSNELTVNAGCGKSVTFTADRADGFDGPIRIDIEGLPPGFHCSTPIVIEPGHLEAHTVVWADADAKSPSEEVAKKTQITATAEIGGSPVVKQLTGLGLLKLVSLEKLRVVLEPAEVTIAPGSNVTATLKIERHGFDGAVKFNVNNLPHGVYVDNIGLNGVLIPEGQSERQISLTARPWVGESDRPFHALALDGGGVSSPAITLHVRRPATVAQADATAEK
ncbi:MAG: pre-peptidase C-terminal domain-containing protein [Pirellulales bacterium]|nr:pre-peptidase C-terminal domain-containing protein [Pirellulales bacterium]